LTSGIYRAFKKLGEDADYRTELKKRAIKQSGKFSWGESAAAVLDIYSQVMTMAKFGGYPG